MALGLIIGALLAPAFRTRAENDLASAVSTVDLGGPILAVAEMANANASANGSAGGGAQLFAAVADAGLPHPQLNAIFLRKDQGRLAVASRRPLPAAVAAYDVCRVGNSAATLLLLAPDGVYRQDAGSGKEPLASATLLVKTPTLFAHRSDEALPRVHLCFALFAGEAPALVVPTLAGIEVYRQKAGRESYKLAAALPADADTHYSWTVAAQRQEPGDTAQLVALRLDFPSVSAVDFDRDGRLDLCLSRGETLSCYLQTASGFSVDHEQRFFFKILSDSERREQSLRLTSQLVELGGATRPAFIVAKTSWNLSDAGSTVYIFKQKTAGGFSGKADQQISRKGYFAQQQFSDVDGDGQKDLVAPVTSLSWSDLMHIYLAKSATIDFIWYPNQQGVLGAPRPLHTLRYPVDFKHLGGLLSVLPLWDLKLGPHAKPGERWLAFFPEKAAVELVRVWPEAGADLTEPPAPVAVAVGGTALSTDLDGDGVQEIVFAYPQEAGQESKLTLVDLGRLTW